ncbi:MAG: response regulator [Anaerolineales bacterium]
MSPTRIVLVDDLEVVRLGLMTLINDQDDLKVVAEAGSAEEALRAVEAHQPDVVLMDIRLPGKSGIEATQQINQAYPDVNVVMLTSFVDDELIIQAIRAGAAGYVLKQVGNEELLRAIRAAARGESPLDPSSSTRLVQRIRELERESDQEAFRELSAREMDVLVELTRGKSNKEIASELNLSDKTVRNYVSNILQKLQLSNRVELATYALEHNLLDRFDIEG